MVRKVSVRIFFGKKSFGKKIFVRKCLVRKILVNNFSLFTSFLFNQRRSLSKKCITYSTFVSLKSPHHTEIDIDRDKYVLKLEPSFFFFPLRNSYVYIYLIRLWHKYNKTWYNLHMILDEFLSSSCCLCNAINTLHVF